MKSKKGFTLVELLVVIAIIGLLSTVAVVSLGSSRMNARNTKRKADLVQISKALELYYAENNTYPSTGGNWLGTSVNGGSRPRTGATGWVPNLAPAYIGVLPEDPNLLNQFSSVTDCTTGWVGYFYRSDTGVDYKLTASCTPEGGNVPLTDSFSDPAISSGIQTYWRYSIFTPGARTW